MLPADAGLLGRCQDVGGDERGIATQLYVLAGSVGCLEVPGPLPIAGHPASDMVGANGKGTLSGEDGTATMWETFLDLAAHLTGSTIQRTDRC